MPTRREPPRDGGPGELEELREALRESQQRYHELFDSSIDLIYEHDLRGNFLRINRAAERISGYSRDEVQGRNIAEILDPAHLERARAMIARKLSDPDLTTYYEIGMRTKDGHLVLLEVSTRLLTRDGKPVAIQGVARDITERKRAERKLAEQSARLRAVFETANDAIFVVDAEGHITNANASTERIFGHPRLELIGREARTLLAADDAAELQRSIRRFVETGDAALLHEREVTAVRRGGATFPLRLFAGEIRVEDQREFAVFARDLTDVKRAQAALAAQLTETQQRADELREARRMLEERAHALSLSNRYKSEFLANMSHELRTPLNSMLLLAQVLERNAERNLSPKEVEYARTIKKGGDDLLELINDVLDLAKVEAGRAEVRSGEIRLAECRDYVEQSFRALAQEKRLDFEVALEADAPPGIRSDARRLKQILRNLLSNAFKFTDSGRVAVRFGRPRAEELAGREGADPGEWLAIRVEDTGIGIAEEQQELIFEAFLQADGSTSREYGGTGLGLAISQEFAGLLGGSIRVESELGRGSRFTLLLPAGRAGEAAREGEWAAQERVADDRSWLKPGEPSVLVVEDDPSFAKTLLEFSRNQGFKGLVAPSAEEGLELAARFRPSALVLDIGLPGMDGWEMLDRLRAEPLGRALPVHVISGRDEAPQAVARGAIGCSSKPVSHDELVGVFSAIRQRVRARQKRLLVVEDDEAEVAALRRILSREGWEITFAETGAKARSALSSQRFDGVVLDLSLPDVEGMELLEEIQGDDPAPPKVVVHTGMSLSKAEASRIDGLSEGTVVKGTGSNERLLEEVRLFLRDVESGEHAASGAAGASDLALSGLKVLVVDDDRSSLMAVGRALEAVGVRVRAAEGGRQCLELLAAEPDVDVVLMDMMMPEMDGYETIRRIRSQPTLEGLPVVAFTAKAMIGDEERCLEAGANDYLSKPVALDRLLAMLRVWGTKDRGR